jgi:superfamily II RNA helicase
MTGDLTLDADAPVVIMTTEIFRNAVFEDPERFRDLDFAIFDEVHFLDDPERGTVWEESLLFAPPHVRFVGLSATIQNLAEFGNWIRSVREHDLAVIEHTERPVPLSHRLYHPAAGVFQLAQRNKALHYMLRQNQRGEGRGRRNARRERGGPGGRGRRWDVGPRPYQLLLDELQHRQLMPALYFCFSRKECEIKAERNMHRRLLDRADQARIQEVFDDICARFELQPKDDPALRGILGRALQGIGFHHAGMLPIHKEVVERLFTSGLLRLLFTTETFALGINMPARTVVFDLLRKFDGVQMDYMRARDYLQMAGRAGRQGMDQSGLVISILEDEDLREGPLSRYHSGKVEPITSRFNLSYSTILNLYGHMGERLLDAYDRSFAAFQAGKGSAKAKEQKRRAARAALLNRIQVLRKAGYMDQDGILARGKLARTINGYEIQVTELLYSGVLDKMDIHQLAVTFAALVHEERRSAEARAARRREPGPLMQEANAAVHRFVTIEIEHGIESTIKEPDFGIGPAIDSWSRGGTVDDLERLSHSDAGDVVRTMRMAIQMMRQLRSALGRDYELGHRLEEAIVAVNRDVVDAKRQFELG